MSYLNRSNNYEPTGNVSNEPDLFDDDGGQENPSLPFLASFDSNCGYGDRIEEGDEIVMYEGEACHVECLEENEAWRLP